MQTRLTDEALLGRLIGFDTTSARSNRDMASFLSSYVARDGVRVTEQLSPCGAKVNLFFEAGPSVDDRSGLLVSGHMDVVPATEPEWTGDPFVMRTEGDRLVGRGACDMKASVAIFANMLRDVQVDALAAPLACLLTYDEEVGALGAEQFALSRRDVGGGAGLPSQVLIGEPTSMRAIHLHKGHMKIKATIRGRSAHSGAPQLGVNAISMAGPLIQAIDAYGAEMRSVQSAYGSFFPDSAPYPVVSVVTIDGGVAMNVVPDVCELRLSIRLLPGMDSSAVIARIESLCAEVSSGTEATIDCAVINDNPPLLGDAGSRLYALITDAVGQTEQLGASFASDGGFLERHLGMNCILFGPGSIQVAHRPDEYVPRDELARAAEVMRSVVGSMCGGATSVFE